MQVNKAIYMGLCPGRLEEKSQAAVMTECLVNGERENIKEQDFMYTDRVSASVKLLSLSFNS